MRQEANLLEGHEETTCRTALRTKSSETNINGSTQAMKQDSGSYLEVDKLIRVHQPKLPKKASLKTFEQAHGGSP